jgi:glycerophosphoryl diester phosphodiesterase
MSRVRGDGRAYAAIEASFRDHRDFGFIMRALTLSLLMLLTGAAGAFDLEGHMRTLIDLGADGIITDYPDRLREVMADKKIALP